MQCHNVCPQLHYLQKHNARMVMYATSETEIINRCIYYVDPTTFNGAYIAACVTVKG